MVKFSLELFEQLVKEGDLYNAQMKANSAIFRIHRKKQYPVEAKMIFSILQILNDNYKPEMDSMIMETFGKVFANIPPMIAKALGNNYKEVLLSILNSIRYCKEKVLLIIKINLFNFFCFIVCDYNLQNNWESRLIILNI